ncbi:MAG: hypothetical protein WB760_20465 [Xanthobacteraceae bacterium]
MAQTIGTLRRQGLRAEKLPERGSVGRTGLLLLFLMMVALAIDATAFDGQYRTAVAQEVSDQVQMLEHQAASYFVNSARNRRN